MVKVNLATFAIPDELLAAARAGDAEALSSLWDTCAPLVTMVVRQSRSRPSTLDPSDIAQEAAQQFFQAVQGDEGTDAQRLTDFLRRRLPHKIYSFLRAERRRLGRQAPAEEEEVERALTRQYRAPGVGGPPGRKLARALERLTPRQRAVIASLYFKDRNRQTVAAEFNLTPKSVSAIHHRALSVLRAALEESAET
jgi:RNA polymerase sigma factor (sigma-70 family)